MGDVLLPATSGRAKCRGCGRAISTGELRFGESLPNAYGEGESLHWFHPVCAACMRPEKFLPVLDASTNVADRDWLKAAAEFGIAHPRVPRLSHAERSKSGKARCRSCREIIEGGVMRLALLMFEEGGRASSMGFIHAECALNYFGTTDLIDRIEKLSPGIDQAALSELSDRFKNPRPPSPESEEQAAEGRAED